MRTSRLPATDASMEGQPKWARTTGGKGAPPQGPASSGTGRPSAKAGAAGRRSAAPAAGSMDLEDIRIADPNTRKVLNVLIKQVLRTTQDVRMIKSEILD